MDSKTAYSAAKFGMWLFLATEIVLFGGLFCAFAIYRWYYLEQFHHASHELNWKMGGLNTMVLLFSSYLAAMSVDCAQRGDNKKVTRYIIGTIICAGIFLLIKYIEWTTKYHHGLFPGTPNWNSPEFNKEFKSFFGLYYCMTGLHALHVIFGMGLLIWVLTKSTKNRFSPDYYTPVEIGALYWHLVDLIWIYLFPLLYLVG